MRRDSVTEVTKGEECKLQSWEENCKWQKSSPGDAPSLTSQVLPIYKTSYYFLPVGSRLDSRVHGYCQ